jgi:acetyltransferase-like isoleucine patch superfamily enzyme
VVYQTRTGVKRARWRPWLWPYACAARLTRPVPPGLWLLNAFCQRVLRINSQIPWNVHFTSTVKGKITIGDKVEASFALSGGCYIQAINGVEIGDETLFAPGVKIISANHSLENLACAEEAPPIRIGKRVWIGANAIILPGIQIGDDAVIGAGAIVTKDVAADAVVVGNPARLIKMKHGYCAPLRPAGFTSDL